MAVVWPSLAVSAPAGRVYSRGVGQRGPVWQTVKEEKVTDCLYMCPACSMLFSQAKCLTVHLKKAHQIECNEGESQTLLSDRRPFFLTVDLRFLKLAQSFKKGSFAVNCRIVSMIWSSPMTTGSE